MLMPEMLEHLMYRPFTSLGGENYASRPRTRHANPLYIKALDGALRPSTAIDCTSQLSTLDSQLLLPTATTQTATPV